MTARRDSFPCDPRNNNPLAIRINPAHNTDGVFEQFEDPVSGLHAAVALILRQVRVHRANSIAKLIRRWVVPTEKDSKATIATIARVVRLTGIPADKVLDFEHAEFLRPVVLALIRIENGRQPYPDAVIDEALARAGVTQQDDGWTADN